MHVHGLEERPEGARSQPSLTVHACPSRATLRMPAEAHHRPPNTLKWGRNERFSL